MNKRQAKKQAKKAIAKKMEKLGKRQVNRLMKKDLKGKSVADLQEFFKINSLDNYSSNKELVEAINDFSKISDDTVVAWNESNLDTDAQNKVFMKDITDKWLSRGYSSGDESSSPTWIEVFNLLDIGPDGTTTVGELRRKLNEVGLDSADKDLIKTLLNQIENDTYHSKGRI